MYIVVIAWMYVVLMMSIAEHSFMAGIMTLLMYGVVPLAIILYFAGIPRRKRMRKAAAEADAKSSQRPDVSSDS